MWQLGLSPLELVARTTIVYLLFFGALRLSGKREIGQFTLFDLALVLLAANALQPAITGSDQLIPGGAIILATSSCSIVSSRMPASGSRSFGGSLSSIRPRSGATENG